MRKQSKKKPRKFPRLQEQVTDAAKFQTQAVGLQVQGSQPLVKKMSLFKIDTSLMSEGEGVPKSS